MKLFDNNIQFEESDHAACFKVIGVGGGGNNSVNRMVEDNVQGVEFIVVNTDAQALSTSKAKTKVIIGEQTTRGKGSGSDPEVGKKAAKESEAKIKDIVSGADMIFIAAGMGGGTGTGAAPLIAKHAKAAGALTVAMVTTPFSFEGPKRMKIAREGLEELRKEVDSIVVISNDKALHALGDLGIKDSFASIDNVIRQAIQTITDLVAVPSLINLDFADVKTVMKNKGDAIIGIGASSGTENAVQATQMALDAILIEGTISGCKSAIVNIASSKDISLHKINDVHNVIKNHTGNDINVLLGITINDHLEDQVIVSIIGTEYDRKTIVEPVKVFDNDKEETIFESIDLDSSDIKLGEADYESIAEAAEKESKYDNIDATVKYDDEDDEEDIPSFLK